MAEFVMGYGNYIPTDGSLKRQHVLRNREIELAKSVDSAAPDDKLKLAAERVRQARLALIRTRLSWAMFARDLPPDDSLIQNLERQRLEWEALTREEIIKRLPPFRSSKDGFEQED